MTTVCNPSKAEKAEYIMDTYKAAHGIKCRWVDFESMTHAELDAMADNVSRQAEEAYLEECARAENSWKEFKQRVRNTIKMGAASRNDAIRWILQGEGLDKEWDASYICYCLGLNYNKEHYFKPIINQE